MANQRELELSNELNELQKAYSILDNSDENKARGRRIIEIRKELGTICECRKSKIQPKVINR